LSVSSQGASDDTVTATAATESPTFFASVFGLESVHVSVSSTAQIQTYTGWGYSTAPWGIDQTHLAFNTSLSVKVDPGNQVSAGNFGALDLSQTPGCATSTGASNYRDMIDGVHHSCGLSIGGQVAPETGNMGSNTRTALQNRGTVNGFNPSTIYQPDGHGGYTLTTFDDPNLVIIPIVQQFFNGHSTTMTIVSFQWFIITSYTKDTVTGQFVISSQGPTNAICPTPTNPLAPCPSSTYTPGSGISTIRLIGP
jgi:hypothetical protein